MFNLVGKVASVVFLVAVIAAGIVLGVSLLGSDDPGEGVDTFQYILADRAASHAAESIRESTESERICILPVGGDIDGEVSDLLEERVRDLGIFHLVKSGALRKAIGEVMEGKEEGSIGIEEAIEIGKKVGAESVVLSNLESFLRRKRSAPAEIDFEVNVVDVESGEVVGDRFQDQMDRKFTFSYFSAAMNETSGWIRLLIWVVLAGLAPFATFILVRAVTRTEKNVNNFLLLMGYTLFDLLLALFLVGFLMRGFWLGLLVFIGLLVGAAYNYIACTVIYETGK